MHTVQFEISKPTDDTAFEDMCARIYGEVLGDPLPKMNGRRGQAQAGVDVFVSSPHGRVGIQCKKYVDGALKFRDIEAEVARADRAQLPITRLIVATTAASDAKLLRSVMDYSDQRVAQGLYPVEVESWNEICGHIRRSAKLQRDYAPNSPGAAFDRFGEQGLVLTAKVEAIGAKLDAVVSLPTGRADSTDKLISSQLDGVNELLKACKFRDALDAISRLGQTLDAFDAHQRARWHVQRGFCYWHLQGEEAAASEFEEAAGLYPGDEKMVAAGVRALLLRGDVEAAVTAGVSATKQFPSSVHVWIAYANARMVRGDRLKLKDAPVEMQGSCDVLQVLSCAYRQDGDIATAWELSLRAVNSPDSGFFVRRVALSLALEAAVADGSSCALGYLGEGEKGKLRRVVSEFEDRQERVWSIQSPETLDETLVHLSLALTLLGRPLEALNIADEAQQRNALSAELMRATLRAYRQLGRIQELIAKGREWLPQLQEEALLVVAEAASEAGDAAMVSLALDACANVPHDPKTEDYLTALRWIALWRSKEGRGQATDEVKAANLASSDRLPLLCGGGRILKLSGDVEGAAALANRALQLVNDHSPWADRVQLADLLFAVDRYEDAARYYEPFAPRDNKGEIHRRLLACYVRSGARRKARDLLVRLPGEWTDDDGIRSLALELGQQVGDWDFLVPLADVQCRQNPQSASAWLLRLVLAQKMKRLHHFMLLLAEVPAELQGAHRTISNIAALELRHGHGAIGLVRLYRLYRRNMSSIEAASSYFINAALGPPDLPMMGNELSVVAQGTSVLLADDRGEEIQLSIDPIQAVPLPEWDGFYSPDSTEVAALLGALVGDWIELPGPLGTRRRLLVKSITSVFRHLIGLAQEKLRTSMSSTGSVASIPVPQTAGGMDFSHMHAMLKQQADHTKSVLDAYASGPLTLGIVADLLNRSVIDLVRGWSVSGPNMFVCPGSSEERLAAAKALEREGATYVVDAATIAELSWLDCLDALACLPRVLASTHTLEILEERLADADRAQASGHLYDDNGVMRFSEFTEEAKRREIASCNSMLTALHRYCDIVPAYGPSAVPAYLAGSEEVLSAEEYSMLLLLIEHDASLLTVDGRLAQLARSGGNDVTVWPQELIRRATETGLISAAHYSAATIKMFVFRRSFVSVSALDLMAARRQGGQFMREAIQRFKELISNPETELAGAVKIAFKFLSMQATQPTQWKAFSELLSHIVEATLRHPLCDAQLLVAHSAEFSRNIAEASFGSGFPYPAFMEVHLARMNAVEKLMENAVITAVRFAASAPRRRAIRLQVLMGTSSPYLEFDDSLRDEDGLTLDIGSKDVQMTGGSHGSELTAADAPFLLETNATAVETSQSNTVSKDGGSQT